jgi:2-hydroxy-3-oxopropionate reductase
LGILLSFTSLQNMAKIGFIGLGIMGKPMAGHLIAGGHTLYLQTRSGVTDDLVAQGGIACATPQDVAQQADIIITMFPDTPDVEKVLFSEQGVAAGLALNIGKKKSWWI